MRAVRPILDYSSKQSPDELTLEEDAQNVRVIFPVAGKWAYRAPIVAGIFAGTVKLAAALYLFRQLLSLFSGPRPASPELAHAAHRFAERFLIFGVSSAAIWWSFAAYSWWMYHRWGRVPRVLSASREGLVLSSLGWWRMRERRWPVAQIEAIQLRLVKHLSRKRTVADLYIHRAKGRRLRFRLSSPQQELPARIAERLSRALDRPAKG
jgi:hypothetical protein